MGIFRKRETYNAQMLREAGLDRVVFNTPQPGSKSEPVADRSPSFGDVGVEHLGTRRGPPGWDTTTTADVPGVQGDSVEFVVLPSGDLIITGEEGDGDLTPLADAIEARLSPPYKATGSRQDGDLWGVGARRIEVAQFAFPDADTLELSQSDGETELRVDGEPRDVAVPVELQRLGGRTGGDFCVQAIRIDGDSWEVTVSPL